MPENIILLEDIEETTLILLLEMNRLFMEPMLENMIKFNLNLTKFS